MKGKDVVLGILNHSSRTGYEINNILKNQLSYFYDGTFGMIYPTLRKLESEGKITKKVIAQDGKPSKKVYAITQKGKDEFRRYMISEMNPESVKSDFLLRMYFGEDILCKEQIISLIDKELDYKVSQLSVMKNNYDKWKNSGMQKLQEITLQYGILYYENSIEFLKQKRSELLDD